MENQGLIEKMESILSQQGSPLRKIKALKDYVLDHVEYKLIGKNGNEELLSQIPSKQFLDMFAVCIIQGCTDTTIEQVMIPTRLLELLDITQAELFDAAKGNTENLDFVSYELLPSKYVVLLKNRCNGAIAMMLPEIMDAVANKMGGDFIILPSSVNEIIVVPYEANRIDSLRHGVYELNRDEDIMKPEDVLSDNIYKYSGETREVSIL